MTGRAPALFENLPGHLRERLRPLGPRPPRTGAEFVLYWCHHALRAHENPALDTAVWAANRLGLPVLVYQGLGGNHRFDSDRHHTFILESARDLAGQLAARNIRHAFCLGRAPREAGPLAALASRAALVVSEEFPVPPFSRWYRRWASHAETPFFLVDTACLVPMQSLSRPFARAYRFRKATQQEYARRLESNWPEIAAEVARAPLDPGFEPVDLDTARIPELCAACEIDHGVGPVPETPGGTQAGYDRWEAFREQGLDGYARLRNDAAVEFPLGVSRLSPYLHYGCVSPFRIAREAAASGARGAKKFLDELLIWRELAHNFCFHCPDPESLEALPEWARRTLGEHAGDQREALYSWEELARARTADPLWNAAQRSLLVQGELHNNLRMTWGKALLRWTPDPATALRLMIDLNHRYALDGSDPNSYGGLLWCLGLFDRPFPEQPVIGTTRARPTEVHARRLDLERFRTRVSRRSPGAAGRVAVVGAGISGLAAARTLQDHGLEVRVFDRGRSVGGRTCSRRLGNAGFDHGAQYFTAREPIFSRHVESWRQQGLVETWEGRIVSLLQGRVSDTSPCARWVGVPAMSAVAKHLAADLDVSSGVAVRALGRDSGGWELLADEERSLGEFQSLVLAVPAPQARRLLPAQSGMAAALEAVEFSPCWALLLHFESRFPVDFDGAFVQESALGWIARDSSKPGRPGQEAWVLHATPGWSRDHFEAEPEEVRDTLLAEFLRATGCLEGPAVLEDDLQRWGYALPEEREGPDCLWDESQGVAACGDWSRGGRIEGAFLSGLATAGRILGWSQ